MERRHTKVPIGRPVGGGRPGRRVEGGPSASYEAYIAKRRAQYGLTPLGEREERLKRERQEKRKEARLKRANAESERKAKAARRSAKKEADEQARKERESERREKRLKRANAEAERQRKAAKRRAASKRRRDGKRPFSAIPPSI